MKRPRSRSFGSDPDDDSSGEITTPKASWSRRDADLDHASSHRRFYSSSSSSKPYDERSASSLSSRKRFDHEADQFDRRRSYWDGDRAVAPKVSSSSPRSGYGVDRMWRSESFSRREFPKGFRSERDRSRRECGGGGWRRSADEVPTVGRSRVGSEDRGRSRSKGGSPGASSDVRKTLGVRKETAGGGSGGGCGNEMEEGELVPEPTMEHKAEAKPVTVTEMRNEVTDACLESRLKSPDENISIKEKKDGSDGKGSELGSNWELRPQEVLGKSSSEVVQTTVGEEVTTVSEGREENTATEEEHQPMLPPSLKELKCSDREEQQLCSLSPEAKQLVEHNDASACTPKSPHLEANAEAAADIEMETGIEMREEVEQNGISNNAKVEQKEEGIVDVEVKHKDVIDLEAEPLETACAVLGASNESSFVDGNKCLTLELMTRPLTENSKDKGKRLMISLSNEAHSMDEDDDSEGPSSRGFELVFRSSVSRQDKAGTSGIVIGKNENDGHKLELLDLSLSLPGATSAHPFKGTSQKPKLPFQDVSVPPLHSSFHSLSDGFTASMSISGSQTFVHNPSCSLTQNSVENYEQSVGSHPLFHGIDQDSDGTVWRGQSSNGMKQKGLVVPLYQRMLSNNNATNQSLNTVTAKPYSNSNGTSHQSNFTRQSSSNKINVSPAVSLEYNLEKKMLTREKSSASLFKSEQRNVGQFSFGNRDGGCGVDTILVKIVSEPVELIGRAFDDMTEPSVSYLKKALVDIFANKDREVDLRRLQEVLVRRSDLTLEILSKCNRVLLEVLVSIRTGLSDFLWRANDVPSSDLVEILLNLKCRNLSCRSVLPVDECDCKICSQKNGFCSTCMCLVCFKFDFAFNTCSWVGCDVCLHWCHTDCALRGSYIRNSQNDTGIKGATETQFHCVACGHPSEMSGFVKDVFKSCAKDWTPEILAKELKYVRRIFFASNDDHGKRLHDVACQLLSKLESRSDHPEVTDFIMEFLNGINSSLSSNPSMNKITVKNTEGSNLTLSGNKGLVPTSKDTWLPPASIDKSHHLETTSSVIPRLDCDTLSGLNDAGKLQKSLENASSVDGLDSVVKFKLAEVKMYQARADDAKREAENLKCIIHAKKEKIEEEYSNRVSKLRLTDAEERRRRKYEEFQALERSQREYLNMKLRMESDIKDLMLKMEATKCNLST